MPRTNHPADKVRQGYDRDRRVTRSSSTRRADPPFVIYETQQERQQAPTRETRASQKRKGKEKAAWVEESDSDEETLQNWLFQQRQRAELDARWAANQRGEPSTQEVEENDDEPLLDDSSDSGSWFDDEELEENYLDTEQKKVIFQTLLDKGYDRRRAYIHMELRYRESRESVVCDNLIEEDATEAFRKNGFEGTYYPDFPTLAELGMQEDFAHLAQACGLEYFLGRKDDTYVDETIDFLCTVCVHVFDPRIKGLHHLQGGGYITFTVKGEDYKVKLREIQELFRFGVGHARDSDVPRADVNSVWRLLTSRPVFAGSNDKGNLIRNPVISYFRRAVANTMYARDTTGNVNKGEAEILVEVVRKSIASSAYGHELSGDSENSGFAFTLACHLMEYRTRAITQAQSTSQKKRRCSIGGVVCAILRMAGVTFAEYQANGKVNNIGYRVMDVDYLQRAAMLHKGSKVVHLYRFTHPQRQTAYIRLPREDLTTLRFQDRYENAEFVPALEELSEPAGRGRLPPPEVEPEAAGPEAAEDEAAGPMSPPVYQGSTAPRRVEQRVNFLAKMQKGMLKSLKRLMGKTKDNEKKIRELQAENQEFRARFSTSHLGGTSAPFEHHTSPTRYSFAGTDYTHQGERGGTSFDAANTGDQSPQ